MGYIVGAFAAALLVCLFTDQWVLAIALLLAAIALLVVAGVQDWRERKSNGGRHG